MNDGKYVFSQLMSLVSSTSFQTCVRRYKGDYKSKHFSCWKQFLCMAFGQLTHRESLSDTMICLTVNSDKLYHLGIGTSVSKSTLSKANEQRDWRIYRDVASLLIAQAKKLYVDHDETNLDLPHSVFAIDATVVDLCLSVFTWAHFRSTKAAIKIHTQLDLKTAIPEYIYITAGSVHEVNVLDLITFQPDSFYVMDRGYIDYKRLYSINTSRAFFVVRAKNNLRCTRLYSHTCQKSEGVRCDQTIRFSIHKSAEDYPEKLRRIKFYDEEQDRVFVFLTNNFTLPATTIALLYKHRWKIELFFKWIKQHLKVKTFWGNSQNAVHTQIWIAISVYVLVAMAKKKFQIKQSLYEILQIFSINIFERKPLYQLFQDNPDKYFNEPNANQFNLFD